MPLASTRSRALATLAALLAACAEDPLAWVFERSPSATPELAEVPLVDLDDPAAGLARPGLRVVNCAKAEPSPGGLCVPTHLARADGDSFLAIRPPAEHGFEAEAALEDPFAEVMAYHHL